MLHRMDKIFENLEWMLSDENVFRLLYVSVLLLSVGTVQRAVDVAVSAPFGASRCLVYMK